MSRRNKLYVALVPTALIAVFAITWWANQPVVSVPGSTNTQVKAAVTEEFAPYNNDYMALQIPKRFVAKQPKIGTASTLYLQQLFTVPPQNGGGVFSDQLAIVVGQLPSGGLQEVSAVQFRGRSADYTQVTTDIPNTIVYELANQSKYEIGYFTIHSTNYSSIVLTTTSADANKAKEQLSKILSTLQWL